MDRTILAIIEQSSLIFHISFNLRWRRYACFWPSKNKCPNNSKFVLDIVKYICLQYVSCRAAGASLYTECNGPQSKMKQQQQQHAQQWDDIWWWQYDTDVYDGEEERNNIIIQAGNNHIYRHVYRWHIWGTPKCFLVFRIRTAVGYNNIFSSLLLAECSRYGQYTYFGYRYTAGGISGELGGRNFLNFEHVFVARVNYRKCRPSKYLSLFRFPLRLLQRL